MAGAATDKALLGTGLACTLVAPGLDLGRDLTLSAGPNGLDLALLDGVDNLMQCLEIALTTALGSDVFNSTFGFDGINALTQPTSALLAREQVRISVINTVTGDQRVMSILDLKLLDGRLDPLGAAGDPTTARTLAVTVAFQTITGDQAAINLGSVTSGG